MNRTDWRIPMESRWICQLLACSLLGAAGVLALPGGPDQEGMGELIRFLEERIATEDPTLSPEMRQRALVDALEIMGIQAPEKVAESPEEAPARMALELLTGEVAPSRVWPSPSSAAEDVLPAPSLPAPNRRRGTASPVRQVLGTFPVPEDIRRDPSRDMTPVVQMARVLLANPGKSSPWEPSPLPTGEELRQLDAMRRRANPGPSRGYVGSAQAHQDRLHHLRSTQIPLSHQTLSGEDLKSDLHPGLLAAAAATLRSIPSPSSERMKALRAGSESQASKLDLPRVVVPAGAKIRVQMGDQTMELQEGSHELLWQAEVEVSQGERILLVYPREGTIFRLGSLSRSRVEDRGVRCLVGEVVKFLSKPGDTLQVLSS